MIDQESIKIKKFIWLKDIYSESGKKNQQESIRIFIRISER